MTAGGPSIVRGPGEGETVLILDGRQFLFKAVSTDTDGAYSLGEFVLPPAGTVLPHIHRENEEAFYVLEGEFAVGVGEQRVIARTGSFILIPRGTVHSLHNAGTTPARLLVVISPGAWSGCTARLAGSSLLVSDPQTARRSSRSGRSTEPRTWENRRSEWNRVMLGNLLFCSMSQRGFVRGIALSGLKE